MIHEGHEGDEEAGVSVFICVHLWFQRLQEKQIGRGGEDGETENGGGRAVAPSA